MKKKIAKYFTAFSIFLMLALSILLMSGGLAYTIVSDLNPPLSSEQSHQLKEVLMSCFFRVGVINFVAGVFCFIGTFLANRK